MTPAHSPTCLRAHQSTHRKIEEIVQDYQLKRQYQDRQSWDKVVSLLLTIAQCEGCFALPEHTFIDKVTGLSCSGSGFNVLIFPLFFPFIDVLLKLHRDLPVLRKECVYKVVSKLK